MYRHGGINHTWCTSKFDAVQSYRPSGDATERPISTQLELFGFTGCLAHGVHHDHLTEGGTILTASGVARNRTLLIGRLGDEPRRYMNNHIQQLQYILALVAYIAIPQC